MNTLMFKIAQDNPMRKYAVVARSASWNFPCRINYPSSINQSQL